MRHPLLFVILAILVFSSPIRAWEFDGHQLDPDKTYYRWSYLWHGQIDTIPYHGTAFDFTYWIYEPYEKNGKTYNAVLSYTDDKGGYYMINLATPAAPGIRIDNGRIYVDREEYMNYLQEDINYCAENSEFSLCPLNPVGDRDYIPYRQTADGELVLYDFTMQPGDKFTSVEGHDDISVISVETITTGDGASRRLLTLSNGYKLIEGIGCINSPGMFYCYLNPSEAMTHYYPTIYLTRYESFDKENSMVIYSGHPAQNTCESVLNANRVWTMKYETTSWPAGITSYTETALRGDTIIGGIRFMEVWYRTWNESEEKPEQWNTKNRFLGQDGGKVFLHHAGIKEPYTELILDFSVETGNTIKVRDFYEEEGVSYQVSSVTDTIIANSSDMSKRRCIHLRREGYNGTDIWIEGIGSMANGVEGDMLLWGGSRKELVKCTEGDVILYQREDKDLSITRHLYSPSVQPQFFDLHGRRLAYPPAKGVYIRDGKKVVR